MTDFSSLHPTVLFTYYLILLVFGMTLTHPIFVVTSVVLTALSYIAVGKRKAVRTLITLALPLSVLSAVINPLFSHAGQTVLAYFPSGNALTLESILYGLDAAGSFFTALTACFCVSAVMTDDKWICLFGRFAPSLSLLLSMTFRFVPRFQKEAVALSHALRTLEPDTRSLRQKLRHGLRTFSTLVTKTLENALYTADSMKARGYGLPGRTAFSLFAFHTSDAVTLVLILTFAGFVGFGAYGGHTAFRFYPNIKAAPMTPLSPAVFAAYALFCALPCLIEGKELIRWKYFVPRA